MKLGGPGVVAVLGAHNSEHRVTVSRISGPTGMTLQAHAQCACGWSTVNVTGALTALKIAAHMRDHPQAEATPARTAPHQSHPKESTT